jgi:hypothetical protein
MPAERQARFWLDTAAVTPFGAHVARVSGYVSASAAVICVVAWLVHEVVPESFDAHSLLWLSLVIVPIGLAMFLEGQFNRLSATGARGLLLLQSALLGLAFGMVALPLAPASPASPFAVLAVAFAALGVWTLVKREAPSAAVMVLVVGLVGFGLATVLLTAFWPGGATYLLFAFGLGPKPQDIDHSGGLEWITSVLCLIMFSVINAAVLIRTRRSFVPPADVQAAVVLASRDARGLYGYVLQSVMLAANRGRKR